MFCKTLKNHCTTLRRLRQFCFGASIASLLLVGCSSGKKDVGPTGDVSGTVTMDGKPLTTGTVVFTNYETGSTGAGTLDDAGKFTLKNPLAVGKYKISFEPPAASQPEDATAIKDARKAAESIPLGYQSATSSGENREVKEGENSFEFKLRKSGPPGSAGGSGGMYP